MQKPSGYAAYATPLADQEQWPIDELQNAAKALEDLQTHPGWAVLRQLAEYRAGLILSMTDPPRVHEQAEYASWHGQRSGIQQVLDAPKAVIYAARERESQLAEQMALAGEES